MKTKHVLIIAAVLVALFVMPGAVAADQSVVTYGIDSSYVITIPHNIPLGTDTKAGEAPISLSDVFIYDGRVLEVSLDSANDKSLKLVGNENVKLSYSMTVDGVDVADGYAAAFLSVSHDDADRAGSATIDFVITAPEIPKAGIYTDTLTFTIEETGDTPVLYIYTVEDLFEFAQKVNSGEDNFAGKTVVLWNDLDLGNALWTPIGIKDNVFDGTFDGQGYTISNINIEGEGGLGLFGYVERDSVIKNVVVKNVKISGNHYAGAIAGNALSAIIDNCKAYNVEITLTPLHTGSTEDLANGYDYGDKAGGIVGLMGDWSDKVTNCYVEDVTITAYRDFGGIVGAGHGTISNNKVNGAYLIQDLTNAYKATVPTTISEINGRSFSDTIMSGNTFSDVEIYTVVDTNEELSTAIKSSTIKSIAVKGSLTYDWGSDYYANSKALLMKGKTIYGLDTTSEITFAGYGSANPIIDVTLKDITVHDTTIGDDETSWEHGYLEFVGLTAEKVTFKDSIMLEGESTLTECTINNDVPSWYGVWIRGGDTTLNDCEFSGTRAIKIHEMYSSDEVESVSIDDCDFTLSEKPGVAIGNLNAATLITITDSIFDCQPGDQSKYIYESDTDVNTFNFIESGNTVVTSTP